MLNEEVLKIVLNDKTFGQREAPLSWADEEGCSDW